MVISNCCRLPQKAVCLPTAVAATAWKSTGAEKSVQASSPQTVLAAVLPMHEPTLGYGRDNPVLPHTVPNQYCNILCLHDRTRCQSTVYSLQSSVHKQHKAVLAVAMGFDTLKNLLHTAILARKLYKKFSTYQVHQSLCSPFSVRRCLSFRTLNSGVASALNFLIEVRIACSICD